MKYVKKWMVVPFEEPKPQSGQEKIEKILNNKSINNDVKNKLINQIKNSFQKPKKVEISNELPKESDIIHIVENSEIKEPENRLERTVADETFFDAQEENPDNTQKDNTFEHSYDYLHPAASTRSQDIQDKSFLDLQKQKIFSSRKRKQDNDNRLVLTAKRTKNQGPSLPPPQVLTHNLPSVPDSPKNKTVDKNIKFKDHQQKPSFLSKLPPVSQSPKTKTQKPNIKIKENQQTQKTPSILKTSKFPQFSNNTPKTPNTQIQNPILNWTTYRKTPSISRTQQRISHEKY